MSDCGCNSSSDTCYPNANVAGQMIVPVTYNNCLGNSGDAANCPPYFQPSTLTTEACVTVPAVGATFNQPLLCNASKFVVGMWVTSPGFGRYPIVGINATTNVLTLQNSCPDGITAIAGNPDPGTQYCGQRAIWNTGGDPCLDVAAACDATRACLQNVSTDDPLCFPATFPVATGSECIYPMGLTAACDSGDCPQPDDPLCWTRLEGMRICGDSICWTDGLAPETVDDTDTALVSVSINDEGQECLRKSPALGFVFRRIYLDQRSTTGSAAGVSAVMNFSVDTALFGVPANAKGVSVRYIYHIEPDGSDGQGFEYNTYIRGAAESSNNSNLLLTYVNSNGPAIPVRGNSDCGSVSVPVTSSDKTIYHEWQDQGTSGSDNYLRVILYLDGYYV